ncbi:MAG: hypothetical protein AB8B61_08285 [Cyclobacteriaceae bacterium]
MKYLIPTIFLFSSFFIYSQYTINTTTKGVQELNVSSLNHVAESENAFFDNCSPLGSSNYTKIEFDVNLANASGSQDTLFLTLTSIAYNADKKLTMLIEADYDNDNSYDEVLGVLLLNTSDNDNIKEITRHKQPIIKVVEGKTTRIRITANQNIHIHKLRLVRLLLKTSQPAQASTKKVLYVGNSYTYGFNSRRGVLYSNILDQMAMSTGDKVISLSHTYPGTHFSAHHGAFGFDTKYYDLLKPQKWDFVTFQNQSGNGNYFSTRPFYASHDRDGLGEAYLKDLVDSMRAANSNTVPLFFMHWGYGSSWNDTIPFDNWSGKSRYDNSKAYYTRLAAFNNGWLSPVAYVFEYLLKKHPWMGAARKLYASEKDKSHTGVEGNYATALTFYTIIFKKDPTLVNAYFNLPDTTITKIKEAVKTVVYDSLSNWDYSDGLQIELPFEVKFTHSKYLKGTDHTKYVNKLYKHTSSPYDHISWEINGDPNWANNPDIEVLNRIGSDELIIYHNNKPGDHIITLKATKDGVEKTYTDTIPDPFVVSYSFNQNGNTIRCYKQSAPYQTLSWEIDGEHTFLNNTTASDERPTIQLNEIKDYIIKLKATSRFGIEKEYADTIRFSNLNFSTYSYQYTDSTRSYFSVPRNVFPHENLSWEINDDPNWETNGVSGISSNYYLSNDKKYLNLYFRESGDYKISLKGTLNGEEKTYSETVSIVVNPAEE